MKIAQIALTAAIIMSAATAVDAKTCRFRLGRILASEITRQEVTVRNLGAYDFPGNFSAKAYAAVAVKLDKGRSLSIYDFSLTVGNTAFPCIAIQENNDGFDAKNWNLTNASPDKLYILLFAVDVPDLTAGVNPVYTLVYNLSREGPYVKIEIPFRNLGNAAFTAPAAIEKDNQ